MANLANGDEVPTPMEPEVGSWNCVEVAGRVPNIRLPMLSWLLAVPVWKNADEPMPILPFPLLILFVALPRPAELPISTLP